MRNILINILEDAGLNVLTSSLDITWIFIDQFKTASGPPIATPRTMEPGPGTLTVVQTDGQFTIASDQLSYPIQATPVWGDQGFYKTVGLARVPGRALIAKFNNSDVVEGKIIGWFPTAALPVGQANQDHSSYLANEFGAVGSSGLLLTLGTVATATDYFIALILDTVGAYHIAKGGAFVNATLFWIDPLGSTATLFPGSENLNMAGSIYYIGARDMAVPPPVIDSVTFTQSLGAELIVNGAAPLTFSGDNLSPGWTTTETAPDPEVTERGTGQLHAGGGTGAANFFSSATDLRPLINQNSLSPGNLHEITVICSALVFGGGSIGRVDIDAGGVPTYLTFLGATTKTAIIKAPVGNATLRVIPITAPVNATFDSFSVKVVTPNAIESAVADGIFWFDYTLTGSPLEGQRTGHQYRVKDAANYWHAYWRRDASGYSAVLDSVAADVATNRITNGGGALGNSTKLISVAIGNNHRLFSFDGTAVVQRGSTVNNNTHATETGYRTVYASATTPVRRRVWAAVLSMYEEITRLV